MRFFRKALAHRARDGCSIVGDETVQVVLFVTSPAADGVAQDAGAVSGVEFGDAGLLLDNLRPVQAQTSDFGADQHAAQSRGDSHSAETTDAPSDHADDRDELAQFDDCGMHLADRKDAEVGLLQADAAGVEHEHRSHDAAAPRIAQRMFQRTGDLRTVYLADRTALIVALDRQHDGLLAVDQATRHDDAVVALRHDTLGR